MSYESELRKLKEAEKKLEVKYGKIAKKRLAYISKYLNLDVQLISLDDKEFKAWVDNNLSILRSVNDKSSQGNNNVDIFDNLPKM